MNVKAFINVEQTRPEGEPMIEVSAEADHEHGTVYLGPIQCETPLSPVERQQAEDALCDAYLTRRSIS